MICRGEERKGLGSDRDQPKEKSGRSGKVGCRTFAESPAQRKDDVGAYKMIWGRVSPHKKGVMGDRS